ncbi:MAG TPA: ATP-binding cassette domain-containing protein [bacterium]|jgi:phospholipid/cholesterol/gamma-HCH transport system ATP-binding protein|nr:ATP-binding cassette domain-containing protein [bacterium]HNT66197.1 ATP-binding cassette domain-containing protein [bacterium]HOX86239.1 ATP-binding cassette domain-containing protein [bacterium]HPG45547.1 ATP-binding cassette domain-containing protein [bacterium]HPM97674.1 ATP-binding cassette domain-containing protein [bacterium]
MAIKTKANSTVTVDPIIKIRNLNTSYGKHQVLQGIDLDIYPEETFVILGRSGCGKSTLLRHLMGLEKPTSGTISIKNMDLLHTNQPGRAELMKKMGVLFQSGALFNSMTVGENVALPLREHTPLDPATIQIMTRMKLELVGLSGFFDHLPAQLSGGMRKRAALARALAMDPEILLCDEPSAGLDPIVAVGIDHLILKLKAAFKMCIIVVTHELASVFLIADRIALLDGGVFRFIGTREEFTNSQDPRVRQFLERRPDDEKIDPDSYVNLLLENQ